jgi:hypothetical protein
MFVAGVIHYFIDKHFHPDTTSSADLLQAAHLLPRLPAHRLRRLRARLHARAQTPRQQGRRLAALPHLDPALHLPPGLLLVLIKTVKRAIDGKPFSWDKLERTGKCPTTQKPPDYSDPLTFERLIFLKQNAAWLLEQELRRLGPRPKDHEIAIGTATDPYQPIERRARITRSLLEVFSRKAGYRIGIVTKSNLILRDIDLLAEIARRNRLVVHITITTPDADLARKLEPRAPRPDLRLAAVRELRQAGITAGVLCCPLLPGITDSEAAIDRMAQ